MVLLREENESESSQHFCLELESYGKCLDFYFNNTGDNLKIFHTNIRSFSHNMDQLLLHLDSLIVDLDLIILSECWLKGGEEDTAIEGFSIVATEMRRNQNDGLIILVNNRLSVASMQIALGDVYGISLDFSFGDKLYTLLAAYKTHDSDTDIFFMELENYLSRIGHNRSCIFVGDINIDLLKNNSLVNSYLDILQGSGLMQCIDKPTRVTGDSSSCLDHIFVRHRDEKSIKSAVFHTSITDHYSIGLCIGSGSVGAARTAVGETSTRTFVDHGLLKDNLSRADWSPVLASVDTVACSDRFSSIVKDCIDNARRSEKCRTTRLKKIKPWMSVELIQRIRRRDKLSKTLKRQPLNTELRNEYLMFRHSLDCSIKFAKRDYFRRKLEQSVNNPKLFWSVINELAGRLGKRESFPIQKFAPEQQITDAVQKLAADEFNGFFASVGHKLASELDAGGDLIVNDADHKLDCRFVLRPVTESEVTRQVMGLRGGSAPGYDNVSADLLKNNLNLFIKPLHHVINSSIATGVFPHNFKIAKVVPLHKSDDYSEKNNYRPISLLSIFSKVLERIVKDQLVVYLQSNNILTDRQYGFRRDKSINDALFDINRDINDSVSINNRTMLIFLDLKKAFDSIDRNKLLKKLEHIGVCGIALSWFRSYLTGRQQFVSICGTDSDSLPVDYGVVQGSNLGPVLFLIYINNICKTTLNGKLYLFADDTLIYLKGKDWLDVRDKAHHDLMVLKKWFDQNLLSVNTCKTKFLPISLRICTEYDLGDLFIHKCGNYRCTTCTCDKIEKVTSYKYLGVIFDSRLNWAKHIEFLTRKIRKYYYAFIQLREILNYNDIKLAYYGYIQSMLSFGIAAWGGASPTVLQPLFVAQKRIIKISFHKNMRYPTDRLFHETAILTVRKIFIKVLLIHMFCKFNDLFSDVTHSYNTRYSSNVGIHAPKLNKAFSTTNSFYISNCIYRNVCGFYSELNLFGSPSASIFKKRAKTMLRGLSVDESEAFITTQYRRT